MKNFTFYRATQNFKMCVCEHFAMHKKWYICLISVALVSLIIGLIAGIRIASDSSSSKIPDSIFLNFIEGKVSLVGVFFSRLFSLIALLILIWATNCKPFLSVVSIFIIIYQSFIIGATCAFLIVLFNVGGILNVIFIIIPTHLIMLFALLGWACVCMHYNFGCKIYGGSIFSKDFVCKERVTFCTFLIVVFCATLLEVLLLPWLTPAIIIS